jgi:hypothetical protein
VSHILTGGPVAQRFQPAILICGSNAIDFGQALVDRFEPQPTAFHLLCFNHPYASACWLIMTNIFSQRSFHRKAMRGLSNGVPLTEFRRAIKIRVS